MTIRQPPASLIVIPTGLGIVRAHTVTQTCNRLYWECGVQWPFDKGLAGRDLFNNLASSIFPHPPSDHGVHEPDGRSELLSLNLEPGSRKNWYHDHNDLDNFDVSLVWALQRKLLKHSGISTFILDTDTLSFRDFVVSTWNSWSYLTAWLFYLAKG